MSTFSFGEFPSTTPPGSSNYISNALIIAKRVALGLEDPVRIQPGNWGRENPLFNWYRRQPNGLIQCMQLRKERKAPFFHEYVAFSLKGNGGCFRIDRRQLPDERSPMDCVEDGVEAYDTIEQITDLEDSMYNPSDCLVQLEFMVDMRLYYILDICREISKHRLTRAYTVQRYNCYFHAQTVVLCSLALIYDWEEDYLWGSGGANQDLDNVNVQTALAALDKKSDVSIKISNERLVLFRQTSKRTKSGAECPLPVDCVTKAISLSRFKGSLLGSMQESDIGAVQGYISDMIRAHGIRVEQYKFILGSTAHEVERDIKIAMNEIWSLMAFPW